MVRCINKKFVPGRFLTPLNLLPPHFVIYDIKINDACFSDGNAERQGLHGPLSIWAICRISHSLAFLNVSQETFFNSFLPHLARVPPDIGKNYATQKNSVLPFFPATFAIAH